MLSSVHLRRVKVQGKGMGGGGYNNCLPHQEERFSLPGPSWGLIHKLPYAGDEHRSGGRGEFSEESVNEGTAQVEKVPLGSFLEGGPSCIIFLTPLQEGLMTLSKDAGLVEEEGGVGMTYREEAPQMPQRR